LTSARPRPFGTTGLEVPPVGQGTWNMEREPRLAAAALRRGIELGLTHVDTAEIYGNGRVEELVGRALAGLRHKVVLVSKVDPARASRRGLAAACEASLKRLRTDWLDVYLLHWLSPHPVAETVDAFEQLVAAGRIRYWGVSNLDAAALSQFVATAGYGRICCNQVMHHLEERSIERAVLPYCREQRVAVVGYSPFGAGAFPPRNAEARQVLEDVAASFGATPRQVALAFLLRKSGGFTIPKASRIEHVEENAAAAALVLPKDAVARLDRAFPVPPQAAGVPLW
jgi:aryl-alcohol dehydrogenase-like predicted oxidoreductase